ncbi:MAG TPA: adenosylcobinamide-GDP ribazoletransferase [Acidisarcina sp.]|nr:adenosylcobinamide-GDP ribazoletransferase [Acidisarcina sp.]
MICLLQDIALAVQFMTRVPVRFNGLDPSRLSRASAWFPAVGLLVGGVAALAYMLVVAHLGRLLAALIAVLAIVMITGGLHEDGLADCADAFGGGWTREDRLRIMKDSRIGSFGALALILSLGSRVLLLATIPADAVIHYLISAHVLARCTPLPLGALLKSARGPEGQGGRIAGGVSWSTTTFGAVLGLALAFWFLRSLAWEPIVAVTILTAASGVYYQRRLGGITGDCMGATIQLSEIAVYFCGAWVR